MGYKVDLNFAQENSDMGLGLGISSPDFDDSTPIPSKFTCVGDNISPTLRLDNVPIQARELVLTVTDPDSPQPGFVHWLLYGISPNATEVPTGSLPAGAIEGQNDFGDTGYGGPCPQKGKHRYVFHLYALSAQLDLKPKLRHRQLLEEIKPYVIAEAELVGLFEK